MAVIAVGAAVALERWLTPVIGPMPMALYFPAVLIAAWYGGLGPGLLATAIALAAPDVVRGSAPLGPPLGDAADALRRLVFVVVGVITSWLNEVVYRQKIQLERAVAEALESEKRFRLTADYAPMMIWLAGPDLANDWVNRRWLEFRGRTLEQEIGEGWLEGVHAEDRQRFAEVRRKALDERRPFTLEYRLRRADGEYRWVLDQGVPRQERDGRFAGFIGCSIDVETMKRAQAENARLLAAAEEAREEADAASRAKDVFLATVSHELRNPLNAIVGWAHILRAEGATAADVRQGAEVIAQSAQAQVRLIEELLDVSRIITGTMRLNRRRVEMEPVLTAAVEALRPAAAAKDLTLTVSAADGVTVDADADRIRQVVTNLVSNAIHYTPEGGRVEVELRNGGGHATLEVRDSGVGIPSDFLPHVFEAFRRSETSAKRAHKGLGIGLSVVRHLVLAHGGSVEARSDGPGQGASFLVHLPVLEAGASVDRGASISPPAGEDICPPRLDGMRVLVVDDDSSVLQLIEKLLSDCNAVVLTSGSVREALKLLPRFRPRVILSDIQMPGADGYDFIRQLRALPAEQGGTTPVAALTAFAADSDRRSVLEAGFQMHLTKPIQPQILLDAVATLGRT